MVGDKRLRCSLLVYYGVTYLVVPDVILVIDRGRPEED